VVSTHRNDDARGRRIVFQHRAELQCAPRDGPARIRLVLSRPGGAGVRADDNYRQFRAGLHATGFRTGGFEWSAGAGWAIDTDDRSCAYGKLGVFTRR